MEIEFNAPDEYFYPVIVVIALLALAGLGWLGHGVTRLGEDGRALVFTWTDYQVGKLEREYLAQRDTLRSAVGEISTLFQEQASPLEIQVRLERIEEEVGDVLPELIDARDAVLFAASQLRGCSLGKISCDDAAGAINHAISLLEQ